jgi:glycerol-3-phosphate dehydrogenase
VRERQRLIREAPGLVEPLGFLFSIYKGDFPGRWTFEAGLTIYDLLALHWDHQYYRPADLQMLAPRLAPYRLKGGFRYGDAQTDDARLTLRVIGEAVAAGGAAINYVRAESVVRDEPGNVIGLRIQDMAKMPDQSGHLGKQTLAARLVINATGAWVDLLRGQVGASPRMRPLRGSHLIFPAWRLPMSQAVTFLHPFDRRPVFIFPWEGVTLVGTTDADHTASLDVEPGVSPDEVAYLMAAVEAQYPSLHITLDDVISTFAGVRPVIGSGKADPSKESRDHVVWDESGLLTVTGGKLTTFRLIARDALNAARHRLPDLPLIPDTAPLFTPGKVDQQDSLASGVYPLDRATRRRLAGRYGVCTPYLVAAARGGELEPIAGTPYLWVELRWAARAEGVVHLDDLLLRRVRLGLLTPQGGASLLPRIRAICQSELGWDDARWETEQAAYLDLWRRCYNLPAQTLIPDWKARLAKARLRREAVARRFWRKLALRLLVAAGLGVAILVMLRQRATGGKPERFCHKRRRG